jgi:hypothetical protein
MFDVKNMPKIYYLLCLLVSRYFELFSIIGLTALAVDLMYS